MSESKPFESKPQASWNKDDWLCYMEAVHPAEIEMGLGRVRQVAEKMDLIRPAETVVLVGGTNGKGTTSALLKNLLACQGKSSGLYNSPHIHQYNERVNVCLNGESRLITDEELIASFQAVEQGRGDIPLTYFEFGTLSALWQIRHWQVDVAIMEIGLGGRLDACNIVDPDLSIVTSVGLDHQDWLGDTLDLIGAEKAGIGRKGKPLVCGQLNVSQGFVDATNNIGANTLYQGEHFSIALDSAGAACYHDDDIKLEFTEYHIPYWNIASAIAGLKQLAVLPAPQLIVDTVANTRVEGRLSRQSLTLDSKTINIVLDVAHNPQAAGYIASQTEEQCQHCVLAMLADKDPQGVVNELGFIRHWSVAGLDGFRGQTAAQLLARLPQSMHADCVPYGSVADALQQSCQSMRDGDTLLVIGSFLTVSEAEDWLAEKRNQNEWKIK